MTGEQIYEIYREERIQQGWQEFLWKSMNRPQQLVWEKLAARLGNAQPAAQSSRAAATVMPFARPKPQTT